MKSDNKTLLIGLVVVIVVALGALGYSLMSKPPTANELYEANKAEMQKSVPPGLEAIPPEKASEGAVMVGGGKTSTAPSSGPPTAPPGG